MKKSALIIFIIILCLASVLCKTEDEIIIDGRDDNAVKLNINLNGSLQNPAFSKDGKHIVFTRFRNGYNIPPSDLYLFNLETGELNELVTDENSNVNLPGECWNSSVRAIVFSSERDPHDEIYMIGENQSTGSERRITNRTSKVAYEPSFSPDGQWIVFESHPLDDEKNGVITKYRIDGSSAYIGLTIAGDDCRQPNWSPAGNKILYQKLDGGQWNIWTMDINGNNRTLVTGFEGNKTDAVFSGDGLFVIFSYENSELANANIYKVAISGGTPLRLTNFQGYDGAPSISADGTKLAFESSKGDPEETSGTTLWILDL